VGFGFCNEFLDFIGAGATILLTLDKFSTANRRTAENAGFLESIEGGRGAISTGWPPRLFIFPSLGAALL